MEERLKELYELGKRAQIGDELALIRIIELKRGLIKKSCYGNEDCYQHIIERLIISIKKYKF